MEAVGLTISIASLATLFQSAVDCFGYVQTGKHFGVDYQTSLLKLDLSQLQLTRWGEAVGLNIKEPDAASLEGSSIPEQHRERVNVTLSHIVNLFKNTEKTAAVYSDTSGSAEDFETRNRLLNGKDLLHQRIQSICNGRHRRPNRRQKLKWVLYDKERLESLVESVQSLIKDLVDAFPPEASKEQELCEEEAGELGDLGSSTELRDLAMLLDKPLKEAIQRRTGEEQFITHSTWNITNLGNTKVLNQGNQSFHGGQFAFTL